MDSWRAANVPQLPGRGPATLLTNTATGQLTVAAAGPAASLYACGITPYDATHIGHAATFLAWDLLVRAWRDAGYQVSYVQNVTDVDDPLLERADRDGEDWRALADREIDRYRADMTALRVLPPDRLVGAVEALDIIEPFAGAGRPGRGVPGGHGRVLLPGLRRPVRLGVRAEPGRDAGAVRRARR